MFKSRLRPTIFTKEHYINRATIIMLKNLKSLFIIEEEEDKPKKAPAKQQPKKQEAKPTPSSNTPKPTATRAGKASDKFISALLDAMAKANLEGFDYFEYKKSLQSLQKMNMDEATAYQSAYAMAQTMGASPEHLLKSAQHYLNVLEKEEKKFESALANQQEKRIGSQRAAQKKLQQSIQDKEAMIQKLQKEIEAHKNDLNQIETGLQDAVNHIENTKNDFIASYQHLSSQINADMENMKKHLK